MTAENTALIKDAVALVRESRHIKRAAGWADITAQLCKALEASELERERLEAEIAKCRNIGKPRVVDAIPGTLTITMPEGFHAR